MRTMISTALLSGTIAAIGGLGLAPSAAHAGDPGTAFSLNIGLGSGSGSGFGLAYASGYDGRGYGYGPAPRPPVGYGTRYESYERYDGYGRGPGGPPRGGHGPGPGRHFCHRHDRWGCSCRPVPLPPPPPPRCDVPPFPRPYDRHDGYRGGYGPPPRGETVVRYESRTVVRPSPYGPYGR